MNLKQMQGIYRMACEGKGYKGNEAQLKLWFLTMGGFEEADVAQGLIWYWETNTAFPMPAELKILAEKARRGRQSSALGWIVRYQCPQCGVTMTSVRKTEEWSPRACNSRYGPIGSRIMLPPDEVCGAILDVLEDRREVMEKRTGAL